MGRLLGKLINCTADLSLQDEMKVQFPLRSPEAWARNLSCSVARAIHQHCLGSDASAVDGIGKVIEERYSAILSILLPLFLKVTQFQQGQQPCNRDRNLASCSVNQKGDNNE